jgi:hypothetical protein
MVLKPKRPTLAKTAPGWGTLKFRYVRTQHGPPLGRFLQHPTEHKPEGKTGTGTRTRTRTRTRTPKPSQVVLI